MIRGECCAVIGEFTDGAIMIILFLLNSSKLEHVCLSITEWCMQIFNIADVSVTSDQQYSSSQTSVTMFYLRESCPV